MERVGGVESVESSGGGRYVRVGGGGQSNLRGTLNRRGPLWEPRAAESNGGERYVRVGGGGANQFARNPESAGPPLGAKGPLFF